METKIDFNTPNFKVVQGTTSTELMLIQDADFETENTIKVLFKANCEREADVFDKIKNKNIELLNTINDIIKSKSNLNLELKKINISRGSIDFELFFSSFKGYRDLSQLIDDFLIVAEDICKACNNLINFISLKEDVITPETESTTGALVASSIVGGALAVAGAPVIAVAAATFGIYKLAKKWFS